jgi:hypothetical protein
MRLMRGSVIVLTAPAGTSGSAAAMAPGREYTHPNHVITANEPRCWYGGVAGGAIYAEGGQFKAVNSRFADNRCFRNGPDLGGALRVLAR